MRRPHLNRFVAGLEASQGGDAASHTTVIGHSYGTTVVGAASEQGNLRTDEIIAVASPGMLVGHADDLDADKGHVWSQTASTLKDQVPLGGKLAGHGGDTSLTRGWSGCPSDTHGRRTCPPTRISGANIMATNAKDHGDYWRKAP